MPAKGRKAREGLTERKELRMPVHSGSDSEGPYFQWGGKGKKYRYKKGDKASMERARKLAAKQGAAAYAHGYKGNEMLQKITVNFVGSVRYDEMMGRKYLVAPMSMITEGVHVGNAGPLYYPSEEIFKTPQVWNHKPVIVYHPSRDGQGVSACDPVILSNRQIGVIMNTRKGEVTVNKRKVPALLAEAWLEEDRMNKVDERIAAAVEKNQMMELSTGLFTDNERVKGEWNGEKYEAIARNYRPDHLALLPDLKGACSIEDGAGFLRLNAIPDKINLVMNAMSHGNIRSLLNSWLQDNDVDSWVEDVYDEFFVFMKEGKYFRGDYSIVNNAIEIADTFTQIVRVTEWRTLNGEFVGNEGVDVALVIVGNDVEVTDEYIRIRQKSPGLFDKESFKTVWLSKSKGINSVQGKLKKPPKGHEGSMVLQSYLFVKEKWTTDAAKAWVKEHKGTVNVSNVNDRKESIMKKEKIVDALIASNSNSWGEDDRETLMKMEDEVLEKMQASEKVAAEKAVENAVEKYKAEEKAKADAEAAKLTANVGTKKPQTPEEFIATAPPEVASPLRNMMASYNAMKAALVKRLIDNKKCQFTEAQLNAKEVDELKQLVALVSDEKSPIPGPWDFTGQGIEPASNVEKVEPLTMPPVMSATVKK